MKKRLDLWLVDLGLARSRTLAQDLIAEGLVSVDGKTQVKPSVDYAVLTAEQIEIKSGKSNAFVSRGGLKLQGALEHTKLNVKDLVCLDLGISTGGFTDCLLQNGAKKIVGVDVGHEQLSEALKKHPQVAYFEGLNARSLKPKDLGAHFPVGGFDLVVMDLSFISITLVIDAATHLLKSNGSLLILVKPQFEGSNDPTMIQQVMHDKGIKVLDYFKSSITGRDGNQEFFLYGVKSEV